LKIKNYIFSENKKKLYLKKEKNIGIISYRQFKRRVTAAEINIQNNTFPVLAFQVR